MTAVESVTTTLHVPEVAELDTLSAALAYAGAGLYVGPCDAGTKHPGSILGKGWPAKTSRDPKQIIAWFAGTGSDTALFIHCGRSGIVAIDVDHPEPMPEVLRDAVTAAPYQSTRPDSPGRGHYLFRFPPGRQIGNSTGRLGKGWGEVRGLNGVIVVAPSRHLAGEYHWERTGPIPVLPDAVAELLPEGKPGEDAATDEQIAEFCDRHAAGPRAELVGRLADDFGMRVLMGDSRHESMVIAACWGARNARAGAYPARLAFDTLEAKFVEAMADPGRPDQRALDKQTAAAEFAGIVAWAVGQAVAEDEERIAQIRAELDLGPTAPGVPDPGHPPRVNHDGAPDGHRYTDTGNADRLVALHGETLRYVPLWAAWLAWDGRRWELDHDDVRVTELAKGVPRRMLELVAHADGRDERKRLLNFATRTESAGGLAAMIRLARTVPSVAVDHHRLDAQPWWLTVANGDLNLRSGVLEPHDPDRLSTKLADVRHDAEATAPAFEAFLAQILPDEDLQAYVQRFVGYCLTGDVSEQVIAIWHGSGANGKSTLINVLRRLLGDYATIAKRELLVASQHEQHPAALVDLFGARLATCVELREGAALDEARVKSLTGGDTIAARRMRENWWSFEPTHKLVVATNHRPQIRADDPATWRRVHLVPFEVTIPPERIDRHLAERIIADELPGVLNWSLAGLEDWRRQGLAAPERVRYATDAYRAEADTVAMFLADEEIRLDPDAVVGSTELREIHGRWCDDQGLDPRRHWQEVQKRLKELGATPGRTNSYRFWKGLDAAAVTRGDAL